MNRFACVFVLLLLSAVVNADSILLRWEAASLATGYRVQHSSDLGVTWDAGVDVGNVLTATIEGPGTGYQLYRAVSYNGQGDTVKMSSGIFYCGDCSPPDRPTWLGAE